MERIQVSSKQHAEVLAARTNHVVSIVNQLIADIESDVAMPTDAAFHAKDAFNGLCRAHNALLDAARDPAVTHYQGMARDAVQAEGGVA
jgi:hypothetical protein